MLNGLTAKSVLAFRARPHVRRESNAGPPKSAGSALSRPTGPANYRIRYPMTSSCACRGCVRRVTWPCCAADTEVLCTGPCRNRRRRESNTTSLAAPGDPGGTKRPAWPWSCRCRPGRSAGRVAHPSLRSSLVGPRAQIRGTYRAQIPVESRFQPVPAGHSRRDSDQRFRWSEPLLSVVPPTGFEPALPP